MGIAINNKNLSGYKVLIFYLILLFIVAGAGWFATRYLGGKARQEILQFNESTILIQSSHFTGEFGLIERAVSVLSGSPLIAPALISRKDEDIANANSALDRYNSGLDSSVSYLIDSNGLTIASSNRNTTDSFVGQSYQFRPYFIQAKKGVPGRYFALGVTSLQRGFYASYPVKDSKGHIIGVVVIKKAIDEREADLSAYPYFFLVDPNGIIFLASKKEMTFKSLWPISRETRLALLESGQFGEREFDAVLPREVVDGKEIYFDGKNYLASRKVINPEGWSIVIMTSMERIFLYKLVGVIITMWICTLIVVPMLINYRTSKSAEMVRASETRYRDLFDNTSSGVAIYEVKDGGKDFIFKDFNKAGERIDGTRKEDIIGKSIHEVRPGVNEFGLLDVLERVWRTGISEHHAASFYHDQKISLWYENFVYKLPTGEMVVVYDDVTDRMRAEEALRESEEEYRRIVETANEGIWVADGDFFATYVNQKMADMLGYLPQEIIGKPLGHFMFPEDLADYQEKKSHRIQGLHETYERRFRRSDGRECWTHVSATTIKTEDGKFMGSFAMLTDITERKLAEEALQNSHSLLAATLESTADGILVVDSAGKVISFNRNFLELWRIPETLIETRDAEQLLQFVLDQLLDPDAFLDKVRVLYQTADASSSDELVFKDGRIFEHYSQPQRINHTIVGLVWSFRDITGRKRAEEERRTLEDRLQRAEKMEALGTLAGGVAHDLNNVLGIVVGYSELLANDARESSSARSRANEILKGGQRAAAIVQDLLTLARRGVSNRKVLNLNNIVLECRNSPEFAGVSSYHPNTRIETDLEEHLLNISGSAVHLGKSLMNLVSNAAEAMPKGGAITIKTGNRYLDKPVSGYDEVREGDYVVLSVSDTGEGIPAGDLKRIFEPFYTKKVMGRSGTGLGLAVIWGTVKDHLGYINVESQEGKGTIFTLYFPVTREEISREKVSVSAAEYMGKGESILIVDDVKEQRELAGTMLEKLNYTVVSVSSGEEAVEYLKQKAVDLVVLDMIMDPGMDGLDTYAKILEIHTHQRAIIVSGFSETARVSRAQALGAGTYVKKPYLLEKLGLAVRKELDRPA